MTRGCEWRHAPEACDEDFGNLRKVGWVEFLRPNERVDFQSRKKKVDFRLLAEALRQVSHVVVVVVFGDGKVVIERLCLCLPYVEKPLNSKVIKSFVSELRSRQVFFVFLDSYVIYIWVMNILCSFHIFMYGYVTYRSWINSGYILCKDFS